MNTVYIMGKEMRGVSIAAAVFVAILAALAVVGRLASDRLFTLFIVAASAFLIFGALLTAERIEDKNHGYRILLRMPILALEVAAGKLLVMYCLNAFSCALMILVSSLYGFDTEFFALARGIILLLSCVWLLLIVLSFTGVYTLGYTRFILVFRVSIMGLVVLAQVLLFFLLRSRESGIQWMANLSDSVAAAPWVVICAVVSVAYAACIPVISRLIRRHAALI